MTETNPDNLLTEITKEIQRLRETSPLYDRNEMHILMQRYENEILKLRQQNESQAGIKAPRSRSELRKSAETTQIHHRDDADSAIRVARERERDEILEQRRAIPVQQPTIKQERKAEIENGFRRLYPLIKSRVAKEHINAVLREKQKVLLEEQKRLQRRREEVALVMEMKRQKEESGSVM